MAMSLPLLHNCISRCSVRGNHKFIYNKFSFQAVYIWNEISRCICIKVSFPKIKKNSKTLTMRLNK